VVQAWFTWCPPCVLRWAVRTSRRDPWGSPASRRSRHRPRWPAACKASGRSTHDFCSDIIVYGQNDVSLYMHQLRLPVPSGEAVGT